MKENKQAVIYSPQEVDVKQMFNDIAPRYDFLNHFLSAGLDKRWRKKTISMLKPYNPKHILDIATGTGDLAIEALRLNPDMITGVDITEEMLKIAAIKIKKKNLTDKIIFKQARSEELPFADSSFDAVMVAFGVRNFYDLDKGLKEMQRVLKKNGVVAVLEFSAPSSFPVKQFYTFYFRHILPLIGKMVSKSKTAYSYLPETALSFPQGKNFTSLLVKAGFRNTRFIRLSMGICTIYIAEK
jgi:demethylmenaquinone methyltransferase/2-methoxy-6-polyprenyl-1,4-benzoquinol methylase